MLSNSKNLRWIVFFCLTGWVCAGPVIGADGAADTGDSETETDLFAEDAATIGDEGISADQTVNVGSFGQIDLHVKDLELSRVLQLLSIQSQRNIVASRNVAGSVSADLYGVDFYEALDAILQPNGFGYREKGNFVYVYTTAEIQAIEEAERSLVHKIVRLNYMSAEDISTFVSPLLSPAGSISMSAAPAAGIQPSISDAGENTYAYSDMVIIRDYPENVDEILAVIKELDIKPKQVLIEASVLQAQLDEANAFGVDFSILIDYELGNFLRPLNVVDTLISGSVVGSPATPIVSAAGTGEGLQSTVGSTLTGDAGFKLGIIQEDFAVFMRALDRVADTTVIANPKLLVLNRQRADLLVGAKLGYLSTTATESTTTQTVNFLEVGTQLSVRPFVSQDEFIRLEIRPSISDGTTTAISGIVIPNQTTQEMTSNILVRNGQTVVLGGLFKEDTEISREQVPIAGDIPLLGAAFKGYDDKNERSEVIFLIKPTIMNDEVLYAQGDRAADYIEMTRLGAREGLLPWSRTRMTASHVRYALKYYNEGDMKKALWWVNIALTLDPNHRDARQIKEKITGERIFWPHRSSLIEAVDQIIEKKLEGGMADASGQSGPVAPAATASARTPADTDADTNADADAGDTVAVDWPLDEQAAEDATAAADAADDAEAGADATIADATNTVADSDTNGETAEAFGNEVAHIEAIDPADDAIGFNDDEVDPDPIAPQAPGHTEEAILIDGVPISTGPASPEGDEQAGDFAATTDEAAEEAGDEAFDAGDAAEVAAAEGESDEFASDAGFGDAVDADQTAAADNADASAESDATADVADATADSSDPTEEASDAAADASDTESADASSSIEEWFPEDSAEADGSASTAEVPVGDID